MKYCFQGVLRKLLLTGTPFRSDINRIPFVFYDDNGESRTDYEYNYRNAIEDGVCRPVIFHSMDGFASFSTDTGVEHNIKFSTYKEKDANEIYNACLRECGTMVVDVLRRACNALKEERMKAPSAGGIILAIDKEHALAIADAMRKINGTTPRIVHCETPRANESIAAFRKSNEKWLIAIKMVSEGVDIPRLKVMVYLTNIKTRLFFIQALGRICRGRGFAHMYLLHNDSLVEIIESIEQEVIHTIADFDDPEDDVQVDLFDGIPEPDIEKKYENKFNIIIDGVIGEDIFLHESKMIVGDDGDIDIPAYRYLYDLKDEINRKVNAIAGIKKENPGVVHSSWLRLGRPNQNDLDCVGLLDKYNWACGLLAREKGRLTHSFQKKGKIFNGKKK